MFTEKDFEFTTDTILNYFENIIGVRSIEGTCYINNTYLIYAKKEEEYRNILKKYTVNFTLTQVDSQYLWLEVFGLSDITDALDKEISNFEKSNNINLAGLHYKLNNERDFKNHPSEYNLYYNYEYICVSKKYYESIEKLCQQFLNKGIETKIYDTYNGWIYIELSEDKRIRPSKLIGNAFDILKKIPDDIFPIEVRDINGGIALFVKHDTQPIKQGISAIKIEQQSNLSRKKYNQESIPALETYFKQSFKPEIERIKLLLNNYPQLTETQKKIIICHTAYFHKKAINEIGQNTFWGTLYPWYIKYIDLFSIVSAQTNYNCIKFILIVDIRNNIRTQNILKNLNEPFEISEINIEGNSLIAFSLYQKFESYSILETSLQKGISIGQKLQEELAINQGIYNTLFALYVSDYFDLTFRILSPGDKLQLFSKNKRISNSFVREDLNQVFRSSWEANIARFLNFKAIKWKYEDTNIDMQGVAYLPDFILDNNTIIEVKGYWDIDSLRKVNEFAKKNTPYSLYFIDSDLYNGIDKIYGDIIPNWEKGQFSKSNYTEIPVVGLSFIPDKSVLKTLKKGDIVTLVREPLNPYDKNAIAVYSSHNSIIGHMASEYALIYSKKIDSGLEYTATIKSIEQKKLFITMQCNKYDKELIDEIIKKISK